MKEKNKTILVVCILVITILAVLNGCGKTTDTSESDRGVVRFDPEQEKFFVINEKTGETILGPYSYIDSEYVGSDDIRRYIDESGLYGFLMLGSGTETKLLTDAIFIDASPFSEGSACVRESVEEGFYYLDKNGNNLTGDYYAVAEPFEAQFSYARTDQNNDGIFELIDNKGEIVLDAQKINPFVLNGSYMGIYGSALNENGNPFIFRFPDDARKPMTIVKEFLGYTDISSVHGFNFAYIYNADGEVGIVLAENGEIIVPAAYSDIEWEYYEYTNGLLDYFFIAKAPDGSTEVFRESPELDGELEVQFAGRPTGAKIKTEKGKGEDKVWLIAANEKKVGPYSYIDENIGESYTTVFVKNNYFGYIDVRTGQEVIPAIFKTATRMDKTAMVSEVQENGIHYINTDGERISKTYLDGCDMSSESQDIFAKVKLNEDDWGIIFADDDSLIDAGLKNINLPGLYDIGTGVNENGGAVIFGLAIDDKGYIYKEIKSMPQYSEISNMHDGDYAIVKGKDGTGVVDFHGQEIVPATYEEIVLDTKVYDEDDGEKFLFVCKKNSHQGYEVKVWTLWESSNEND